jgi:hypothetical protein
MEFRSFRANGSPKREIQILTNRKDECLVCGLEHLIYFPIQLGMSSSQLTFTPSFFREVGVPTTNQMSTRQ